jgi:hypothetical protein
MAAFVNDRTVRLQAESPRFFAPGDRMLLLAATANIVKNTSGTLSPTSVTFVANLLNMTGTVTFSTSPTTPLTISGNTATLAASDIAGNSVSVTATFTKDAVTYTSTQTVAKVSDGATGAPGTRGAGHFWVVGTSWSDTVASAACPGGPVTNDVVTIYNNSPAFIMEKVWTGSAWVLQANVYDGSLLVTGSVTAAKVTTPNLAALSATIGTLRTASSGGRTEIKDNVITIYDASNTLRLKQGNLLLS